MSGPRIECWTVVWDTARGRALEAGYPEILRALRRVLHEPPVDIDTNTCLIEKIRGKQREQTPGTLVVIGHRQDLDSSREYLKRLPRSKGFQVVEIQFTTAEVAPLSFEQGTTSQASVPYCTLGELVGVLSKAEREWFRTQQYLNAKFEQCRSNAGNGLFEPLIVLAVLVDGYLALHPNEFEKWFDPAIDSIEGSALNTDHGWNQLQSDGSAGDRLSLILCGAQVPVRGIDKAVLHACRQWLVPSGDSRADAKRVNEEACRVVKTAWDVIRGHGLPGDELLERARLGIQVLAAGHL